MSERTLENIIFGLQTELKELKAENERLKSFIDFKTANVMCEKCKEQIIKAETERLTAEINQRREMMHRMDCNYATELQKNVELQKQVDELKSALSDTIKRNEELIEENEQAAKDTAKEILEGFIKWLNQAISESYDKSVKGSIHYGGKNSAFHEVKELVKRVAESKGVKVE